MLNLAWERQPKGYRQMCETLGRRMGPLQPTGMIKPVSPQNRRVRFAADMELCRGVEQPERPKTRQQRRREARNG